MHIETADQAQLKSAEATLSARYAELQARGLSLDMTRGKPSPDQLSLSDAMESILNGNFKADDGTDLRNYGGLDGITEAKDLFAQILEVPTDNILIGGNASLTLMYQSALYAMHFGLNGAESAWHNKAAATPVRFICPVPGYDRHFAICDHLGIEMLTVPMTDTGPDMDAVEALIDSDPSIRGIWAVPRFSNPTGVVYSDETVDRFAQLGKRAHSEFRIFWDNAYAVHTLNADAPQLKSIWAACEAEGTLDSVLIFGSTSKVTYAGAGVAFMGASTANLKALRHHLSFSTIGPDKVNMKRHTNFLRDMPTYLAHMEKHAALLRPRFNKVNDVLTAELGDDGYAQWHLPQGGYFISLDTKPGLAQTVVDMAAAAGVKLTPAGATFPYGKDPANSNLRIAPSFPSVADLETATEVLAVCVKLATVRQKLNG